MPAVIQPIPRGLAKAALGLLGAALGLALLYNYGYYQPRLRALQAEERRLDAEIAAYRALLPELERVTAERDAKRRELLFLEEFDRTQTARSRGDVL
jgi:hypothetical protein